MELEKGGRMILTIDSRDLAYTVDMYGMFNGEGADEMEGEWYRDEYGIENIEFDYDAKSVLQALAEYSVGLLHTEFVGKGIVRSIDLVDTTSPQFYNFTTDAYTAKWDFHSEHLDDYIAEHMDAWWEFQKENWPSMDYSNTDDEYTAKLDFYTRTEYSAEDYMDSMFEFESEAWLENMKPTEEYQLIIDKIDKERDI